MTAGVAVTLLIHGLSVLDNYVNTRIDQSMVLDFRSDLFQHAQRLRARVSRPALIRNADIRITAGDAAAKVVMTIPPLAQRC